MAVDPSRPRASLRPVPKAPARKQSPGRRLMSQLLADIASGTVSLHSPDHRIAERVARGVAKATHERRMARLLGIDPALSAKTLRAACASARLNRPRTLTEVVEQLDRHYVTGLVAAATEIESPLDVHEPLRRIGRALWQTAMRVSTLSYLLANLDGRFDPDEAALAGLLHNLGDLALLSRAAQEPPRGLEQELLEAIRQFGPEIGAQLARSWSYPGDLVAVCGVRGDWFRDHERDGDLADVVLIAQLHARMGGSRAHRLPVLDTLPAFHRLRLGNTSPRFSLNLLEAANNALALTQKQIAAL